MKAAGIMLVYLLIDHAGFYERYGWEFVCLVQGEGSETVADVSAPLKGSLRRWISGC